MYSSLMIEKDKNKELEREIESKQQEIELRLKEIEHLEKERDQKEEEGGKGEFDWLKKKENALAGFMDVTPTGSKNNSVKGEGDRGEGEADDKDSDKESFGNEPIEGVVSKPKTLKEFIIKGFVLDDNRLKNGKHFGVDYFRELLERIRSIRASERRIYLQITDIFQECSIDYDPKSQTTKDFFAATQNKFHFAITGQTAAEIIYEKADSKEIFM